MEWNLILTVKAETEFQLREKIMTPRKSRLSSRPRKTQSNARATPKVWAHFELPTGSPTTFALNPGELFAECSAQEQRAKKSNVVGLLDKLARFYIFDRPLFGEAPDWANDGYPLLFTIRKPTNLKSSKVDWRYSELLRYLKNLDDPELRWTLIARWLNIEGVCDPEHFLPSHIFRRMLKKTRANTIRLSPSDIYLWRVVRIWLPYFEYLLSDLRKISLKHRGPLEALVKIGYSENAVRCALAKRSAVQAVTSWLELRSEMTSGKRLSARTLENAHSRVLVAMDKANADFGNPPKQTSLKAR
jgi:transposase